MTEIEKFIKTLTENSVGFYCTHTTFDGECTIHLAPAQIVTYLKDPPSYLAHHYGITREQYIGWHQSNYSVRCAGKTAKGKPCQNIVENGHFTNPKEWVALQGSYCHVHQEIQSP